MNDPKRGSSFSWLLKITYFAAEFLSNSYSIDTKRSYTVAKTSDIKGPQLRTFIKIPTGNTATRGSTSHSIEVTQW